MNLRDFSLIEVAAFVARELRKHGVTVVVVGGSAVTAYAPEIYTSHDIDFAATSGIERRKFTKILRAIGFVEAGRTFAHPDTLYTIDFVADTPYVDQRAIQEFNEIGTAQGPVQVVQFEDAIADRIAAFLHWNDSQSLDVAERCVRARTATISWQRLESALRMLDVGARGAPQRLELAIGKLRSALDR